MQSLLVAKAKMNTHKNLYIIFRKYELYSPQSYEINLSHGPLDKCHPSK